MKIGDFLTQHPRNESDALSKHFAKIFSAPLCPRCHTEVWLDEVLTTMLCTACGTANYVRKFPLTFLPVAGSNTDDEAEEINHALLVDCQSCGAHVALLPTLCFYNANHDTYYTGGRHVFSPEFDPLKIEHIIRTVTQQWIDMRERGQARQPWELACWIQGHVEAAVAQWLYDQGLKR